MVVKVCQARYMFVFIKVSCKPCGNMSHISGFDFYGGDDNRYSDLRGIDVHRPICHSSPATSSLYSFWFMSNELVRNFRRDKRLWCGIFEIRLHYLRINCIHSLAGYTKISFPYFYLFKNNTAADGLANIYIHSRNNIC